MALSVCRRLTSKAHLLRALTAFPPSLRPQRLLFSTNNEIKVRSDGKFVSEWPPTNPRPPMETQPFEGCDFNHWLVVTVEPPPDWTRDQIIDHYIKTLAAVIGSEDEARMKIYSVSTKYYFAFGALLSEELAGKLRELTKVVSYVLPDCYLDVARKDYGGEPFIGGQAVPYDPKYHMHITSNPKATSILKKST